MGTFVSNNAALAVVALPLYPPFAEQQGDWVLVLDQINDPGNLGTIIRVADWYGIRHILCSPDTVDAFNPKVIASAKGSFLRVRLHYQPLVATLAQVGQPIYGAYLGGGSQSISCNCQAQVVLSCWAMKPMVSVLNLTL